MCSKGHEPHAITELLMPGEAARDLNVTRRTLNDWVRKGWITPAVVTPGNHARFTRQEVERVTQQMRRRAIEGPQSV